MNMPCKWHLVNAARLCEHATGWLVIVRIIVTATHTNSPTQTKCNHGAQRKHKQTFRVSTFG